MNLIETLFYGFLSGLSDIVPVSAQAHRTLLITLFGEDSEPALLRLLIHIGTVAALYFGCQNHILRIFRAYRISRIPKRRRTRPLDMSGLMDLRMLQTMLIPLIFAFIFYQKITSLVTILSVLSFVLLLNGVILYIPQYLPGSNKDSLSLSPLDSILMGLAASASLVPGISCVGAVISVAAVRGADRTFSLNIALLTNLLVNLGLAVYDVIAILGTGLAGISFGTLLGYLLAMVAAFGGTLLGITLMKKLAATRGFGIFAYYCWGAAMFLFVLFLSV